MPTVQLLSHKNSQISLPRPIIKQEPVEALPVMPELALRARSYSGSGDWLDESGNGNHATTPVNVQWNGESIVFDGSGQVLVVSSPTGLALGVDEAITIVAVHRYPSSGAWGKLYFFGTAAVSLTYTSPNRLQQSSNDGTGFHHAVVTPFTVDEFHTVAGVWVQGGAGVGFMRLHVDDKTGENTTDPVPTWADPTSFLIGARSLGGDEPAWGELCGIVAVRGVLNAAEIMEVGTWITGEARAAYDSSIRFDANGQATVTDAQLALILEHYKLAEDVTA